MSTQNKSGSPAKASIANKSESNDQSGEAKATTPAASTRAETKAKAHQTATKTKKPMTIHYSSLLALVISLVLSAAVFYLWQQNNLTHQALLQQLEQQQTKSSDTLSTQSSHFSSIETKLLAQSSKFEQLGQDQKQLSQAFRDLLNASRHLKQDWLISEAEYLVNLAGQRLALMRDVKTAVTALQAADRRLSETGNPELLSIRKALSKDINQLEAVQQADLSGLSFKLNALLSDVDQLKLLTPKPDDALANKDSSTTVDIKDWQQLPTAMWQEIKKLVVIREHPGPIKPLLAPEQSFFLNQNLKLQLEQARLAMLSGETQIYTERLTTARLWISKWYDGQNNKTVNLINQIDDLLNQTIHPPLPTLKNSFTAFKFYHKNINLPESVKKELKTPVKKPPVTKKPDEKVVTTPKQPAEKIEAKPTQPASPESTQVPL